MTNYLQNRTLFTPHIHNKPSLNLGIVIVIPCYKEDYLLLTLLSLKRCNLPDYDVEVIVVINDGIGEELDVINKNKETFEQATEWAVNNSTSKLKFHIIYKSGLPKKHAGVGLARKIGMDEACFRLEKIKNPQGIIVGFDADSKCEKNYFLEIEKYFREFSDKNAASIHFEHPVEGIDFEESVYDAIIDYELHLRYYVEAKKYAGFPFATQTIGSSMAVRCDAYQQQGGMNKRKAGEDFYFLHKFTQLGKFGEIKTTKVIPSPRISDRVPFGTGKAVGEIIQDPQEYLTYNPDSFKDLKLFFASIGKLQTMQKVELQRYLKEIPKSIGEFLIVQKFEEKLKEIQSNTTTFENFKNRFFRWFNAFLLMKYLHFSRDNYYPNINVHTASKWLLSELNIDLGNGTKKTMLKIFRRRSKEG